MQKSPRPGDHVAIGDPSCLLASVLETDPLHWRQHHLRLRKSGKIRPKRYEVQLGCLQASCLMASGAKGEFTYLSVYLIYPIYRVYPIASSLSTFVSSQFISITIYLSIHLSKNNIDKYVYICISVNAWFYHLSRSRRKGCVSGHGRPTKKKWIELYMTWCCLKRKFPILPRTPTCTDNFNNGSVMKMY